MAGMKKGTLVRVIKDKFEGSLEAKASDARLPDYLLNSKAEILEVEDEYALLQFYVPTPSVWLRLDQLEEAK
jgi:hypothetical protein